MVIANHKKGIIVFITQYMYESVTYYIIKGKEKNYLDKKNTSLSAYLFSSFFS